MKPEIKALWLEALRSGEYTQGKGALRSTATETTPEGFCCLGVLCHIHSKQTNTDWELRPDHLRIHYLGKQGMPSYEVMRWAGLTSSDPIITINNHYAELSKHNDGYLYSGSKSFAVIANAIETQL